MDGAISLLRRFSPIRYLNSALKTIGVQRSYRATVARYAARPRTIDHEALFARRLIRWRHRGIRHPRIFFLGTDEQQDRSGLLQALERVGDLRWFTRADGRYGQNDPSPVGQRVERNTRRLWDELSRLDAEGWTPQVLLAQSWPATIEPEILSRVRDRWGTLIVNLSMDDRHQYWGRRDRGRWQGTFGLIPHIDLALTAAPECVEWYEKEGCPAVFFPEASDPVIFHPMPTLEKIHEVSFVGARYGIRDKIVSGLQRAGIRVSAFGLGWETGRIAVADVPRLFAQSKIVLGVGTIGHCENFFALKLRDFDAPMSGSFYLTHANPDLKLFFDFGKEIETYGTVEECVGKVKAFLRDERLREEIARAGRRRAVADHTWDVRLNQLFSSLRKNLT